MSSKKQLPSTQCDICDMYLPSPSKIKHHLETNPDCFNQTSNPMMIKYMHIKHIGSIVKGKESKADFKNRMFFIKSTPIEELRAQIGDPNLDTSSIIELTTEQIMRLMKHDF